MLKTQDRLEGESKQRDLAKQLNFFSAFTVAHQIVTLKLFLNTSNEVWFR